jgi:alanyl-tRNA synthetase
MEVLVNRLDGYGFPLSIERSLIPNDDDQSTLFMCSGMQRFKSRFRDPDRSRFSTLQSCLRMNDLDLVGDGSHLTYFEMIGNFSFGNNDYDVSVDLWHEIVSDLKLPVTSVHVHPSRKDHRRLWTTKGYDVVDDPECIWSDGDIGGYSCELYCGGLEIGNLVHTGEISTDVGFGFERIVQVVEGCSRVDQSSLFMRDLHPVVADHSRAVQSLLDDGIQPGQKGRAYVLRRLLRRILRHLDDVSILPFDALLKEEREIRQKTLVQGRKMIRKHGEKSDQFWWETFGVLPEERDLL